MTIPTGYAQVQLRFGSQPFLPFGAAMTFGVHPVAPGATPAEIAGLVDESITNASLPSLWVPTISMNSIFVKKGPDLDGPSLDVTDTFPGTSSQTVPGSPQVSLLIKKGTAGGGRRNRGRMYMPGLAEGNVGGSGEIETGFLSGAQTVVGDFLDSLDARDIPMVILHSGSTTPTEVITLEVDARSATQRRRLRR